MRHRRPPRHSQGLAIRRALEHARCDGKPGQGPRSERTATGSWRGGTQEQPRAGCALPLEDRRAAFSRVVALRRADKPMRAFRRCELYKGRAFSAVAEQRNRGDPLEIGHIGHRPRAPECNQSGGWAWFDLKSSNDQTIRRRVGKIMMIDKAGRYGVKNRFGSSEIAHRPGRRARSLADDRESTRSTHSRIFGSRSSQPLAQNV